MKLIEAIKAKVRPYPVQHTSIEVALIDRGLTLDSDYSLALKSEVNLVCIELYKQLLSLTSVSQSDASLGFDVNALKKRLVGLMKDEGLDASDYATNKVKRLW